MPMPTPVPQRGTPARPALRALAAAALLPLAWLAAPAVAAPDKAPCNIEKVKKEWTEPQGGLFQSLGAQLFSARCSSVTSVLKLVSAAPRTGGRKLEPDKALNVAEAQAERSSIAADPALAAALASELQDEPVRERRLLLEAAFLHDQGLYKARDLVLSGLRPEAAK